MYYLLEWLNGLLRLENVSAILGSLRRRILGQNFLEMRITLNNETILPPVWGDLEIRGYSEHLEKQCISLLNSIGSLGLWYPSRFKKEILPSVEDPLNDIFVICDGNAVVGFAVLHNKSPSNNLPEVGYVAVRPESRGKKLGYKLLMYILAEMKKRNIYQAYLKTDSFRLPAIKTYLKVGFHPHIKDGKERSRWEEAMDKLGVSLGGSGEGKNNTKIVQK